MLISIASIKGSPGVTSTSLALASVWSSTTGRAAVLLESIVRNHPLVDGNKRLGWLSTVVVYGLNGVTLEAPDDDAYDLVIAVASGESAYPQSAVALEPCTLS